MASRFDIAAGKKSRPMPTVKSDPKMATDLSVLQLYNKSTGLNLPVKNGDAQIISCMEATGVMTTINITIKVPPKEAHLFMTGE